MAVMPDKERWPCCRHCIDGDGMLPCYQVHPEPCGDCGWSDAELAEWRKGLSDEEPAIVTAGTEHLAAELAERNGQ